MSYVQEQQRKLFKDALEINNTIHYNDFVAIIESCQIASGSNFGVGRIKGILDFIDAGNEVVVINFNKEEGRKIALYDKFELANAILSIDEYFDIRKDSDCKKYF